MAKKKNKKRVSKSVAVKDQQLGKKKETAREKMIGQSIGYRYDVNLLPDYSKMTPFLKVLLQLHQLHDPIPITANFPTFTAYQARKHLRVAANLMIISLELK